MALQRDGWLHPGGSWTVLGLLLLAGGTLPAQQVSRAYVGDADGLIHIRLSGAVERVMPPEGRLAVERDGNSMDRQSAVSVPVVAKDGHTVAWIASFPNCCTSYPIPLTLVVFRDGRILQRFGGRAIFHFAFVRGGREIAYCMDVMHGPSSAECVLRDVQSGTELAHRWIWDTGPLPPWAAAFRGVLTPEEKPEP